MRFEPLEIRRLLAADFSDTSAGLPAVRDSSVAWGDYDNDGDLDVLISGRDGGNSICRVYQNTGGTFSDISAGLLGVGFGSVAWGDYDNDGDLDILISGTAGGNTFTLVYRNTNGSFSDISAGLPGVWRGEAVWGDYDNDGDLDILVTGNTDSTAGISRVYQNTNGTFSDISANIVPLVQSTAAWGDYDNDGDLDILITGISSPDIVSRVYNNTNGTFSDISAGLAGVHSGSVAWGDYDNDGDLDIMLSGAAIGGAPTVIYRNTNGSFSNISAGFPGVGHNSVAWGDYDNDGDLDLLISGQGVGGPITRLFQNTNGTFSDTSAALPDVQYSSVAWGDYDNDGDLDLLITGETTSGYTSRVYRNNGTTFNTVPNAPTGLTTTENSPTSITFSWNAPTDGQTSSAGLSYNLRVGTTPGGSDVLGPMALDSGLRTIAERGPIQTTSYTLDNLTEGKTYFWSVQAIDTALAGSPFAPEAVIGRAPILVVGSDVGDEPRVQVFDANGNVKFDFLAYRPGFTGGVRVAAGDVDGDGVLDIITAQGPGGAPRVKVFSGVDAAEIRNFYAYDLAFRGGVFVASADFDRDHKDDIVTGAGSGGGPQVRIFSGNDLALLDKFFAYSRSFKGGVTVAAGDVDGDGYVDVITGPGAGMATTVKVFSGFDQSVLQNFTAYANFMGGVFIAAGDLDGDGKADIVTGAGAGGGPQIKAFKGTDLTLLQGFFAYEKGPSGFHGGVRPAVFDFGADGTNEIVVGPGAGAASPKVKIFDLSATEVDSFFALDGVTTGGLYLG